MVALRAPHRTIQTPGHTNKTNACYRAFLLFKIDATVLKLPKMYTFHWWPGTSAMDKLNTATLPSDLSNYWRRLAAWNPPLPPTHTAANNNGGEPLVRDDSHNTPARPSQPVTCCCCVYVFHLYSSAQSSPVEVGAKPRWVCV